MVDRMTIPIRFVGGPYDGQNGAPVDVDVLQVTHLPEPPPIMPAIIYLT